MDEGDQGDLEIETTAGARPRGSMGERLLLGVAALALLGGVLIGVAGLLPQDTSQARTSAAPASSMTPAMTASPRPQPTPRVAGLVPFPEPFDFPRYRGDEWFHGWIRVAAETPVRARPDPSASPVATLPAGTAIRAGQQPPSKAGWVVVTDEAMSGYVDLAQPGIERFADATYRTSADLYGVAAGDDGFVTWGNDSSGRMLVLHSADGAAWRSVSVTGEREVSPIGVAHGPEGWLAAFVQYGSANGEAPVLLYTSPDGVTWGGTGALEPAMAGVGSLAGSDFGYVAITYGPSAGAWFSPDGARWQQVALGEGPIAGWTRAISLGAGAFLLTSEPSGRTAYSTDGLSWQTAREGPDGPWLQAAPWSGGMLATDLSSSGVARVWQGIVAPDGLRWQRRADLDAGLAGARVTALIAAGPDVIGFGFDVGTGAPILRRLAADGWRNEPVVDPGLQASTPFAASGPAGAVLLSSDSDAVGSTASFWRLDGGRWRPAPTLPGFAADALDPAACPALPTDILEVVTMDAAVVAACHGDRPMTFRAYAVVCPRCYELSAGERWEPRWLADPTERAFGVAPTPSSEWIGDWTALDPSVAWDEAWAGRELEFTAHLDDPAAVTCRWWPGTDYLPYRAVGPPDMMNICRRRLVVTAVRPVE